MDAKGAVSASVGKAAGRQEALSWESGMLQAWETCAWLALKLLTQITVSSCLSLLTVLIFLVRLGRLRHGDGGGARPVWPNRSALLRALSSKRAVSRAESL